MKAIKSANGWTIKISRQEWNQIGIMNRWIEKKEPKKISIAQSEISEPPVPVSPSNPLDGKSNEQARKIVRNIVDAPSKGLFKDEYWEGPKKIFDAMSSAGLDWHLTDNYYGVSKSFSDTYPGEKWRIPNNYKEWKFEIQFVNNRGRATILHGVLTAHGAGSVQDPLEKYDMTVVIG